MAAFGERACVSAAERLDSHFDGQVAATGFDNLIVIQHDDGMTTLYGHLTHDGAAVSAGDLLWISCERHRQGRLRSLQFLDEVQHDDDAR